MSERGQWSWSWCNVIGQEEIRKHIPHAGAMCLLQAVDAFDKTNIVARACSHRDPANPLKRDGVLSAVCGIEYAAQAMAVHASVTDPGKTRPAGGFLASLREVGMSVERLDTISGDLLIVAERLSAADDSFIYAFRITSEDAVLVTGRVAVKLMGAMPA